FQKTCRRRKARPDRRWRRRKATMPRQSRSASGRRSSCGAVLPSSLGSLSGLSVERQKREQGGTRGAGGDNPVPERQGAQSPRGHVADTAGSKGPARIGQAGFGGAEGENLGGKE